MQYSIQHDFVYVKFKNRQNSSIVLEVRILVPSGREEGGRGGASGHAVSLDLGGG